MKQVFSYLFFFFCTCIAPQYLSAVGAINGTVTDSVSSLPISGALVQAVIDNQVIYSDTTAPDGTYSLTNVQPGNYTLIFRASEHQTQLVGVISNNDIVTVNIQLESGGGGILGTVTDALTTLPISGARISVYQGTNLIERATANGSGFYSVPGLAPGNYTVQATATGYQSLNIGASVRLNLSTEVDFALNGDPGTIRGIVTDSVTTNPIMNALVAVFNGPVFIDATTTNSNGSYALTELDPGNYTVVASTVGFQSEIMEASVAPNRITIVNFALNTPPGTITGTVTDASSNPIPGATIDVFQGVTLIASVLTDQNGEYSISEFATGNYTVLVTAQGFQDAFSTVAVVAGMTTTADFVLNANPGTIAGTVTDQCTGGPLPGAIVIVSDGSTIVGFGVTDPNGNYSIDTLAPGNYTVTAAKNNFQTGSASATVVSNETTTVNFSLMPTILPPASISGCTIKNEFLTQTEYVHFISWTASPSSCVIGYQVFRNGKQIALVPSTSKLKYHDHNRNKKTDVYFVKAVNSFGLVSDAVSVTVGPKSKCPKK